MTLTPEGLRPRYSLPRSRTLRVAGVGQGHCETWATRYSGWRQRPEATTFLADSTRRSAARLIFFNSAEVRP